MSAKKSSNWKLSAKGAAMNQSEAQKRIYGAVDASRNVRQATTLLVYRSGLLRKSVEASREQSLEAARITRERILQCSVSVCSPAVRSADRRVRPFPKTARSEAQADQRVLRQAG
jgi:hypothetical protein